MALIKPKEGEYSWIKYIQNRIKSNRNALILISGRTGSGKSWAGLSIAHMLNKKFTPKEIIFSFEELMDLIEGAEKYPRGSVFLWDEMQITASSRDWQRMTNKLLNSLLTTFRHKNFILILTTPYADFIDSQARKLLHIEFETKKIDYQKKLTRVKPFILQYNSSNKKIYKKYMRVRGKWGAKKIEWWDIPKAPEWLISEYEEKKIIFTTELNRDIKMQLKIGRKDKGRKPLTEKQHKIMEMLGNGVSVEDIAENMQISPRMVYAHKDLSQKKGFYPEEFAENREKGGKDSS